MQMMIVVSRTNIGDEPGKIVENDNKKLLYEPILAFILSNGGSALEKQVYKNVRGKKTRIQSAIETLVKSNRLIKNGGVYKGDPFVYFIPRQTCGREDESAQFTNSENAPSKESYSYQSSSSENKEQLRQYRIGPENTVDVTEDEFRKIVELVGLFPGWKQRRMDIG